MCRQTTDVWNVSGKFIEPLSSGCSTGADGSWGGREYYSVLRTIRFRIYPSCPCPLPRSRNNGRREPINRYDRVRFENHTLAKRTQLYTKLQLLCKGNPVKYYAHTIIIIIHSKYTICVNVYTSQGRYTRAFRVGWRFCWAFRANDAINNKTPYDTE